MADATKILQIVIQAKDEATKALTGFQDRLQGMKGDLRTAGTLFAGLGAATAVAAKGFFDAASEMEVQQTAFTVLLRSADKAKELLKELTDFAASTPFSLRDVTESTKQLLAYGFAQDQVIDTTRMLGDVAAGLKIPLGDIIYLYGTLRAQGRAYTKDLNQFTSRGIPILDALAKQYGITTEEVFKFAEQGKIGFADVEKAFQGMTNAGSQFGGMMQEQMGTTSGKVSNLGDSVFKLQAALGQALLPAVKRIIDALLPAIEGFAKFATEHQNLTAIVVGLGLAIGALGTAMIVIGPIIGGIVAAFHLVAGAVGLVVTIVGTLVAILGGPLTIIIGIVAAAIALFALAWKNNWLGIRDIVNTVVEWFKTYVWPILQKLFELIKDAVISVAQTWIDRFKLVIAVVEGVVNAIKSVISIAQNMANLVKGGLKIPGFQHGGFVPGGFGDAVPAILHGGERIVPRNGTDVNGMGGGGASVTINFTGDVALDSPSRVQELADKIITILGRQNELAAKGVGY